MIDKNFTSELIEMIDDELYVSHRIIAEKTDNQILSVQKLITDNIEFLERFGKLRFKIEPIKNAKNRINEEKTYYLNEPQTTLLLTFMRNNEVVKNFKIRLVEDFYRMRELLKNSSTQKQTPIFDISSFSSEKLLDVQKTLLSLETAIKILKVSEASKLLMTETIYRELEIKTDFLPKYSDEKHTYSLTHLLKKFGSKLSAQKVNQKLLEIGILEIKTRKSHKKEKTSQMLLELEFNNIDENVKSETILEFKSLTEKGLKFGKNLINPNNELQTQPHYFESSFAELLNLI
jgi:phage regulator Rha-like protein